MPTNTTKLKIPKPLGNETVSRANHNTIYDQIDKMALKEPFLLEEPTYDAGNDRIVCNIGPGIARCYNGNDRTVIIKTDDLTAYYITAPAINTAYYIHLKGDGTFTHNTTNILLPGAVTLWRVNTGATVSDLSKVDMRELIAAPVDQLYTKKSGDTISGLLQVIYATAGGTSRIDLKNSAGGGSTDYSEYRLLSEAGTPREAVFRMRNNSGASIGSVTNDPFFFITNNTMRAILTAAGQLGIGMTPTANDGMLAIRKDGMTTFGANAQLRIGSANTYASLAQLGFCWSGDLVYSPAVISFIATNSSGNVKGDLLFGTRDSIDDIAPTERMRITASGRIGVGRNDPQADKMEVYQAGAVSGTNGIFRVTCGGATNYPLMQIQATHGGNFNDINGLYMVMSANGYPLYICDTSGNPFFNVHGSTKRVGINVAVPGYALDVQGNATEKVNSKNGYLTNGADTGEYFESLDGTRIPFATSVVLEGDKIRPAREGETPIGVISATCSWIGNNGGTEWPHKYMRDQYGDPLFEDYQEEILEPQKVSIPRQRQKTEERLVPSKKEEIILIDGRYTKVTKEEMVLSQVPIFEEYPVYDEAGNQLFTMIPELDEDGKEILTPDGPKLTQGSPVIHRVPVMEEYFEEVVETDDNGATVMIGTGKFETKRRPVLNPAWDPSKEPYIRREDRPEWNVVGLLGQVRIQKGQPVAPGWIKLKDLTDDVELWLIK